MASSNNPRVAQRYANSLMELAQEQGQAESVANDMKLITTTVANNPALANMLKSPIISADKKKNILEAIFKGKVNPITLMFTNLLVNKNREANLPQIAEAFIALDNKLKGIQVAYLTTPVKVDAATKQQIINQLNQNGQYKNIQLEEKIDPSLIGGYTLQIGDKLLDNSIRQSLQKMKKEFASNS